MAWTWGNITLGPNQSGRWWLSWGNYPGFEVIGVKPLNTGSELICRDPGVHINTDGSTLYWITVVNNSPFGFSLRLQEIPSEVL